MFLNWRNEGKGSLWITPVVHPHSQLPMPKLLFKLHCVQISQLWVQITLSLFSHWVVSDSSAIPWTVALQDPLSMRLFQAKILEWVAMPTSKGSSWPKDQTCISCVSCIKGRFFTADPPGKPETQRELPYFQGEDWKQVFLAFLTLFPWMFSNSFTWDLDQFSFLYK